MNSWIRGISGSVGSRGRAAAFGVLVAGLVLAPVDAPDASVISKEYLLDFETTSQSTNGPGASNPQNDPVFLGIDTGPNPFKVGGVEAVTIPGWWIFPSTYLGKYGVELEGNFDLRTGFEINTRNDAGTINAAQQFQLGLTYENQWVAGQFATFATTQQSLLQKMQTTFPNVGLDIDLVFQLDTYMKTTACVVDCVNFDVIPRWTPQVSVPIFDYNRDQNGDGLPDGSVEIFGLSIPDSDTALSSSTGNPSLTIDLGSPVKLGPLKDLSVGSVTIEVPQAHTGNEERNGDSKLTSGAQDDFLNITLDVDNVLSLILSQGKTSQLFGAAVTVPVVNLGIGYELFNFGIGWDMDYRQDFTLVSNLVVDLAFSEPVLWRDAQGVLQLLDSWRGPWSGLPDFTIGHEGTVEVTPKFDLLATLHNLMALDYDLQFVLELFKFWFDSGPLGNGEVHLFDSGDDFSIDLFRSPVFETTFDLGGWNRVAGEAFQVHFTKPVNSFDPAGCAALSSPTAKSACYVQLVKVNEMCGAIASLGLERYLKFLDGLQLLFETPENLPIFESLTTADILRLAEFVLFVVDTGAGGDEFRRNPSVVPSCGPLLPTTTVTYAWQPPVFEVVTFTNEVIVGGQIGGVSSKAVPEPGTLLLLGAGLGAAGWMRRRRRS